MDTKITIFPKHDWFKDIQLIIGNDCRLWKKIKTGEIITEFNKSDGFNVKDFEMCFSFLSTETNIDAKIALDILDTPIVQSLKIYEYDTGTICTGIVESLETSHPIIPKKTIINYGSIFDIIGSDYYLDQISIKTSDGKQRKVAGYPDSVYLRLDYVENKLDNILYYGYQR